MRARRMRMRLLVGRDRKLRDVCRQRALGGAEADMTAAGAANLRERQRQVDRIGNEIGVQCPAVELLAGCKIVRLAVEAALEVPAMPEHEIDVFVQIDHDRRIGHRHEARGRLAGPVEMLMPAVERDAEDRARLPFEGHARTGIVPDRGRAAPVQDVDHLLEQLAVRIELATRRDLADIAVVAGARGIVVEKDRAAAAALPGLEVDGAQVTHIVGAAHLKPLLAHPAQVGGVLLGLELRRQIIRHDGPLCRSCAHLSCAHFSCSMMARSPSTTSAYANRARDRSLAFIASTSRFRGGRAVASDANNRRAAFDTSSTARLNAASLAFEGSVKPLSLRTNWSAEA